jgi:hypothetical protein
MSATRLCKERIRVVKHIYWLAYLIRRGGTLPMTSPKEYRKFALECSKRAEQTKDERLRKLLKDESRLWMEAALEVERCWSLMDDGNPAKLRN